MKRLYRVRAVFTESGRTYTRTWHYQDKRAAEHRAEVCREGRWAVPEDHMSPGRDAIPAADSVTVERSNAVTWPDVSPAT